jgi:hypothetical protein
MQALKKTHEGPLESRQLHKLYQVVLLCLLIRRMDLCARVRALDQDLGGFTYGGRICGAYDKPLSCLKDTR